MKPKLILLDEPMAGMNLEEKEDMARYILDLNEEWGMTVIMIEHDIVVMDISHRLIVLDFGRMIARRATARGYRSSAGEEGLPRRGRGTSAAARLGCRRPGRPHGGERAACARLPEYRDSDTFLKLLAHNAAFPEQVAMREKEFGIWNAFSWADYQAG